MGLDSPGKSKNESHEGHTAGHQPETYHVHYLIIRIASAQDWHGISDDRKIDRDICPEERQVTMRRCDLCAVGIIVNPVQRMQEAPDTSAKEGNRCRTKRP